MQILDELFFYAFVHTVFAPMLKFSILHGEDFDSFVACSVKKFLIWLLLDGTNSTWWYLAFELEESANNWFLFTSASPVFLTDLCHICLHSPLFQTAEHT